MRKAKASLIATIAIGLLAISTAGVSTYAWFQAASQVQIQTSGDSTTITVSKPDDYSFYAYNGNQDSSHIPEDGDWEDDFTMLSDSNMSTYTSFEGMYPGKAMTFVFVVDKCSSLTLNVDKIKSNDVARQNQEIIAANPSATTLLPRYVSGKATETTMPINIGWAIDIRVTKMECNSNADLTGYSSFVNDPTSTGSDIFIYDEEGESTQRRSTYLAGSENDSTHVITLTNPIELYNNSTTSSKKTYLFYSVVFSDASTTYYQEVTSWNGENTPKDFPPTSGNRYFHRVSTGNSNCYSDLAFALSHLNLIIG